MLNILLAAACLVPAARAAGRSCANGAEPRMTGDILVPVRCSTGTLTAVAPSLQTPTGQKPDLKPLVGNWEGAFAQGLGRYELRASLKVGWTGKVEGTLSVKESQFHDKMLHTLTLAPAKGPGRYAAELSTDWLSGKTLKGLAVFAVPASTGTVMERKLEISLDNGASHEVLFAQEGPNALRVRLRSKIPTAPPRAFEAVLRRSANQR